VRLAERPTRANRARAADRTALQREGCDVSGKLGLGALGSSTLSTGLALTDGSRVGVIGGGPAGSFFSYFLLDMARRAGLAVEVDIYEPRDFGGVAPQGCNMCGGIVSESLVQMLAAEGINLPGSVIQRASTPTCCTWTWGACASTPRSTRCGSAPCTAAPGPRREGAPVGELRRFLQHLAEEKGARTIASAWRESPGRTAATRRRPRRRPSAL